MLTKCSIIKAFTCFIIDNYDVYDAYWMDMPGILSCKWALHESETLSCTGFPFHSG